MSTTEKIVSITSISRNQIVRHSTIRKIRIVQKEGNLSTSFYLNNNNLQLAHLVGEANKIK
ncbi:MAG: hypothetical protein GX432_13130 [Candidatus Atribacteria bacterium]|nr:hypothetical protein [Candidatus Atribacteria bacterium]